MAIWLFCALLHLFLAQLVSSAWLIPQLTLVGMISAILQRPRAWLLFSLLSAWVMSFWAIRLGYSFSLLFVLLGFIEQWILQRWELNSVSSRLLLVALTGLSMDLLMVWLEDCWSWAQLGLCFYHATITAGTAIPVFWRILPQAQPSSAVWRRLASVKGLPFSAKP